MVKCEVVGYSRIEKHGKTFYHISACAQPDNYNGYCNYSGFVYSEHLKKHNVSENDLIGTYCNYYSIEEGKTRKSGFTFKNTKGE